MASLVLTDKDVAEIADLIADRLRRAGALGLPPATRAPVKLSPREKEVLALLLTGASADDISRLLFMSKRTAEVHRSHILAKMEAKSPVHLGWLAACMGFEPSDELAGRWAMGRLRPKDPRRSAPA